MVQLCYGDGGGGGGSSSSSSSSRVVVDALLLGVGARRVASRCIDDGFTFNVGEKTGVACVG